MIAFFFSNPHPHHTFNLLTQVLASSRSKRSDLSSTVHSNNTSTMTTLKRLNDDDVRAVFDSLHNHSPPPPHLQFQIVPVGPRGLKLSPPSHEFEDGLYVLLRPQKKKKSEVVPYHVPDHLSHLIMKTLPPETCPWSLSGPQ